MPDRHLRTLSTNYLKNNALGGAHPLHALASDIGRDRGDNSGWIAAADGAQFERDVVAIEQAAAILRRAEPALQSWAEPALNLRTPRPLWQLIGVLWLSTALIIVSAMFAIYGLVR
jgi:hypothetical protein